MICFWAKFITGFFTFSFFYRPENKDVRLDDYLVLLLIIHYPCCPFMCELSLKIPRAVNLKLEMCSILCIWVSRVHLCFFGVLVCFLNNQNFVLVAKGCSLHCSFNRLISYAWISKRKKKHIFLIKIQIVVVDSRRCIFGFLLVLTKRHSFITTLKYPLSKKNLTVCCDLISAL